MRSILMATSALTFVGVIGSDAEAATCNMTGLTLVCSQPGSAPVVIDQDGVSATIDAGADITTGENAIEIESSDVSVENNGLLDSGERAIRVTDGNGNISVENNGTIRSVEQAVRADNDQELPDLSVVNNGVIESIEGRAIQSRGPGTVVENYGALYGFEEVVEARDGFSLYNAETALIELARVTRDASGTIIGKERQADEDGVQFASGEAENHGTIIGTDDGIDMDEGRVFNGATGRIVSLGPDDLTDKGAVDMDAAFDNSRDPERPAGKVTVINEGYMEGPRAVTAAYDPSLPDGDIEQAKQQVEIVNSGIMVGRGGIAIGLAPTQGDSVLRISGDSEIHGDVLFGGGDDLLDIGALSSGMMVDGLFDGGDGANSVKLTDYMLEDVLSFDQLGADLFDLTLATLAGDVTARFANWDDWSFGQTGARYSSEELMAATSPVPLPAGMALLLSGLAGLGAMRRLRRRA